MNFFSFWSQSKCLSGVLIQAALTGVFKLSLLQVAAGQGGEALTIDKDQTLTDCM